MSKHGRDAGTGRFVPLAQAKQRKETSVVETTSAKVLRSSMRNKWIISLIGYNGKMKYVREWGFEGTKTEATAKARQVYDRYSPRYEYRNVRSMQALWNRLVRQRAGL